MLNACLAKRGYSEEVGGNSTRVPRDKHTANLQILKLLISRSIKSAACSLLWIHCFDCFLSWMGQVLGCFIFMHKRKCCCFLAFDDLRTQYHNTSLLFQHAYLKSNSEAVCTLNRESEFVKWLYAQLKDFFFQKEKKKKKRDQVVVYATNYLSIQLIK